MPTDLVCGMEVDPGSSPWRYEHGGVVYSFCHPRCLEKFQRRPDFYVRNAAALAKDERARTGRPADDDA